MPLNRDQSLESNVGNSAPLIPTEHQRTHSIVGSDLSLRSRPSTPQNGMNTQSTRREHVNPNVQDGGRRYHVVDEGSGLAQLAAKDWKLPAVDTMQKHQFAKSQHSASTRFQGSNPKQENLRASTGTAKSRREEKQKASAFDETESLHDSMLNDFPDDNRTALQDPQRAQQYPAKDVSRAYEYNSRGDRHDLLEDAVVNLDPDWMDHVDEERRLHEKQGFPSNAMFVRKNGGQSNLQPTNPFVPRQENDPEPETPTRPHSVPPAKAQLPLPAPAPAIHKTVNFASSDQIHNLSPSFRSSELGRDDSFEQPISRPNSAQPRVQTISHPRVPRTQQHLHSQLRLNQSVLPSQSGRFQEQGGHLQAVRQEGEKVSAPESDNQDYSEDEPTQTQQQYSRQDKPLDSGTIDPRSVPSRKRSHDDMTGELDYSQEQLKQKSLSALQAEAFTRDPRAGIHLPPTDSVGNEMTLPQILENLSKVPEDAQRETFKSLTDEQWAKTGQWFVDKFQADLKKLADIRLQRRQIALKYEDAIRRRQRLVEQHQAEVNRELNELQTGGKRLVDGRKVPSGSRSGTPMKGGR